MASVQELLAAADAEKSPLIKLLEGAATGFASGQNQFYDNAVKLVQAQKAQQEMQIAQAVEQRKAAQRAKAMADEQALKENFRSVSGAPSPVMPVQKLTKVTDEEGNVTTSTTYGDSEDSLNSLLTQKVKSGEMTLDQAYQLKNRSGGGLPASLIYTMGKDQEKKAAEEKAKTIPGYTRTGEVNPDDTEVRNLRTAAPELETFKSAVTDYKALISKYGTQEMGNREVQGQMNALAKNLQLKVKNLAQLGVLSASDVPFIEEQIPGPGLFKTKEGMLGALKTAESLMETAVQNRLKTAGYKKDAPADLSIGTVEDGYRYKGGDKADPNNWEKVQ